MACGTQCQLLRDEWAVDTVQQRTGRMEQQEKAEYQILSDACLSLPPFYAASCGLSFHGATNSLHKIAQEVLKDSWQGRGREGFSRAVVDGVCVQIVLYWLKEICFSSKRPRKELLVITVQEGCATSKCFPNDP